MEWVGEISDEDDLDLQESLFNEVRGTGADDPGRLRRCACGLYYRSIFIFSSLK